MQILKFKILLIIISFNLLYSCCSDYDKIDGVYIKQNTKYSYDSLIIIKTTNNKIRYRQAFYSKINNEYLFENFGYITEGKCNEVYFHDFYFDFDTNFSDSSFHIKPTKADLMTGATVYNGDKIWINADIFYQKKYE
jgi:hypothetical protein